MKDTVEITAQLHWFEQSRKARENKIINSLVSQVRERKATFEALYGGINAIAELRSIQIDLENQLKTSTLEAEREKNA